MLFNISFIDKKHKFANIELDALLTQNLSLENIVSEHTLENGDILNDAIHNLPLKMSLSAVISDLPQSSLEQLSLAADSITEILKSTSLTSSKSLKAFKELYAIWKSKTLITVSSPLQNEAFSNLSIKNIVINVEDTESLNFTVDLREVLSIKNIKKLNLAKEIGKQSIRL